MSRKPALFGLNSAKRAEGHETMQPPEKKRKFDPTCSSTKKDQLWDDETDDFTEDQLENIDSIIASQQVAGEDSTLDVSAVHPPHSANAHTFDRAGASSRTASHVTGASGDDNFLLSKPKYPVKSNTSHTITDQKILGDTTTNLPSRSSLHAPPALTSHPQQHQSATIQQTSEEALQKTIRNLTEQCERLKKQNKEQQDGHCDKDGRIKILQEKLTQQKKEIFQAKQDKILFMDKHFKEQNEKEKTLEKTVEKLKTQLQFKEQELFQLQDQYKHKEKFLSTSLIHSSPRRQVSASPHRSNVNVEIQSTRNVEKTPSKTRPTSSVSEAKTDDLASRLEDACGLRPKMRLKVCNSKGHVSGGQLVYKIMHSQTLDDSTSGDHGGGSWSLLQCPPSPVEMSGISLERDNSTMLMSPARTSKRILTLSRDTDSTVNTSTNSSFHENNILMLKTINSLLGVSRPAAELPIYELLETDTAASVGLLPIIEGYIDTYIALMESIPDGSISSPSLVNRAVCTDSSSMETVSSTTRCILVDSAKYANQVEDQLLNSLQLLRCTAEYSSHFRDALLFGNGVEKMNNKPSTSTSKSVCESRSLLKPNQILSKLCQLANPAGFHVKPGNLNVCKKSLHIISIVLDSCPDDQLDRFHDFPLHETLLGCMSDWDLDCEGRFDMGLGMLEVLHSWIRSPLVVSNLCVQSEDCLLENIYQFFAHLLSDLPVVWKCTIHSKLISLLSTLMSCHKSAAAIVTLGNRDCQCNELLKNLVSILHDDFHAYHNGKGSIHVLQEGAALLQTMSVNNTDFTLHHQEVETQYVEFVCGINNLYKTVLQDVHEIEKAVTHDLWDFKQDLPSEEEEELPRDSKRTDDTSQGADKTRANTPSQGTSTSAEHEKMDTDTHITSRTEPSDMRPRKSKDLRRPKKSSSNKDSYKPKSVINID